MKNFLWSLVLIFPALTLQAQFASDKDPFMTKSFDKAPRSMEVETSGGNIAVTGDASQTRVEVFVWPSNGKNRNSLSKEEIQKRLDEDYDLTVSLSNEKLTLIARPKSRSMNWKKGLSISFKVFTSSAVSTELRTSGGNIDLAKLNGSQDFTTSGGNLNVSQVTGKMKGRTSGGNIRIKDSKEEMNLATSGGNIDATNCQGEMKLTTSGGNLSLNELKGDIEASTSGGNVEGKTISGELSARTSGGNIEFGELSCSLDASTSGGHIRVAITEPGKYVKINNSGGNIDLMLPRDKGIDLKLTGSKIKMGTFSGFNGKMEENEVEGTLNGGGVPVTVRAGSGRISLEFR